MKADMACRQYCKYFKGLWVGFLGDGVEGASARKRTRRRDELQSFSQSSPLSPAPLCRTTLSCHGNELEVLES